MKFGDRIAREAKKAVREGYIPSVKPACANFVSAMLSRAGWKGSLTNYVPDFLSMGKQVNDIRPGDLVIFERTYDAVPPAGIGKEDDLTHVGIICGKDDEGVWEFAHFSSSADRPVISHLLGYWKDRTQLFIRLPDSLSSSKNYIDFKIFYHPTASAPKAIIDYKKETIKELLLTALTDDETEITVMSHKYEKDPFIRIDDEDGRVVSVELHIKFEKEV